MVTVTFVHAADLHLGAPFRGLDAAASDVFIGKSGSLGNLLAEAGFKALARLEAVCIENKADFLILSGDIYDGKDGVLRARLALRDMFARLEAAAVQVFIAHGNHDPLQQGPASVSWPDNVTVFGSEPQCCCVMRDDSPLALVHGVSHAVTREKENLAVRFVRYTPGVAGEGVFASLPSGLPADIFQIAALHCAVGGIGDMHAPYAPCTLSDLTGAGFDYWALGHVHQGKVLSHSPLVVYPGSLQGMHINETGAHGCTLVRMDAKSVVAHPVPLAPVVWGKIYIDLSVAHIEVIDELESAIFDALDAAADESVKKVEEEAENGKAPQAFFCRVTLQGRTALDKILRRPGNIATLLERLRKEFGAERGASPVRVWLKDIVVATSPERDAAALLERNDLVGEVARISGAAANDPAMLGNFAEQALESLYGHHRIKKILSTSEIPGMTDFIALAAPGDWGSVTNQTGGTSWIDQASSKNMAELATSAGALLVSLLEDE